MKIERFRVVNVDDFGGRVSEVRTSTHAFEAPSRAATSTEYNYKIGLLIEAPFDNDVGEYVARYNSNDIAVFTTKNSSYESRLRTAGSYSDQMKFVVSKWFPQFPYAYNLDEKLTRLLLDVQIEGGFDVVSILHSSLEERNLFDHYSKWARYVENYAEQLGREVVAVPHVPMRLREDLFESTIEALWDARSSFPVIGLTYGPIRKCKINYELLRSHRDEDSWLHMSGVPRATWLGKWGELANMHLPQIYGIDTVATGIPMGGGGSPPEDYHRFRYFDQPTLSIPRIDAWVGGHGSEETDCPCPICRGRAFPEITEEFVLRRGDRQDLTPLYGVFRLHEVFQSSAEFQEGRTFISENDFSRYLKDHIGDAVEDHLPE